MSTRPTENAQENDHMALALIEHLGPHALAGDKMTPIDAFERGYKSRDAEVSSLEHQLAEAQKDAERMKFLHNLNMDGDGYIYGAARVKFDEHGKIRAFFWAFDDNSDIDLAMKESK